MRGVELSFEKALIDVMYTPASSHVHSRQMSGHVNAFNLDARKRRSGRERKQSETDSGHAQTRFCQLTQIGLTQPLAVASSFDKNLSQDLS